MNARILNGDCLEIMPTLPAASVDLTVTSPPYDNLRTYNGSLNDWTDTKWQAILVELYRLTKPGGVVVWVVNDATIDGSETGTSFRQALYAMSIGFRLHDTMIWNKGIFAKPARTRYAPVFEYMFVFSKGAPKTFNPIKDRPNKRAGEIIHGTIRQRDGSVKSISGAGKKTVADFGQRFSIWDMSPEMSRGSHAHPAPFPLSLAADHIASWSNPGDLVFDPFLGSGTTGKMAIAARRRFIGIERDPDYFAICQKRINESAPPVSSVIDIESLRQQQAVRQRVAARLNELRSRLAVQS